MIEKFEVGESYRFIGDHIPMGWASAMGKVADGKPHKCIAASYDGLLENEPGMAASFEDVPTNGGRCWDFSNDNAFFVKI